MGNGKNLPQHGKPKPALSLMLNQFTEKKLRGLFPVATPVEWRVVNQRRSLSERFLAFVQRFDASSNSFPSMHTSVAMLTALHLQPYLGAWAFLFPLLIALSCIFTKQHYVVDLPAGATLGWMTHGLFLRLV